LTSSALTTFGPAEAENEAAIRTRLDRRRTETVFITIIPWLLKK
jgi:hypothetical protein